MKEIDDAITSEYLSCGINEDISIYEGRFCIYLDKKYRCNGRIYYKMTPPISINFKAEIGCIEEIDNKDDNLAWDYDNAVLEVHGYKIISITINILSDFSIEGYINDDCIKSKNSYVEHVDFNIINLDKIPGKLIKYNDKVYAGRIEFDINDYVVTIDKRYDYRKELKSELKSKSGAIITHIGRVRRKDGRIFRTNNTINLLDRISTALSFMCGRYVGFCLAKGYRSGNEVYRIWNENQISPFKYVPTWSDTLSNYHNMEKYISLMCKKLEDFYYGSAIKSVVDWYIESLGSVTMENNIISVQIALETLSYVILVEQNKVLTDEAFDCNLASRNIRMLLDICKIPYGKHELNIFDNIIKNKFDDGVDLVIYLRNSIVHPSRKTHRAVLEVEDIWNTISIGTRYIELILLFILGYRGEYSNRLVERCYGEVEVVPWS